MDNIIVLTQNLKLPSLKELIGALEGPDTMILSTQFLFENERDLIDNVLHSKCLYITFADILDDSEREKCDFDAFNPQEQGQDVSAYYAEIKLLKNRRIIEKVLAKNNFKKKIIVSDDLGIFLPEWVAHGFQYYKCEYYYVQAPIKHSNIKHILKKVLHKGLFVKKALQCALEQQIFEAYDGRQKYLFYGSLNRIAYRLNLKFKEAGTLERLKYFLNLIGVTWANNIIRMSTFHEGYHTIKDSKQLNVKLIQDGYLPPNYSSRYLYFYGRNTEFYAWDEIGCHTFQYHHLPYRIIPFRKKLYLPSPKYPSKIKKVLCVASGAGDWTAIKNRSDEDMMLWTFGKVAKMFPEIEFVYRCHPVWIHPAHQGVNSINRAAEYIQSLNLPNMKISCHIPNAVEGDKFRLSYKRTSFEEDLENVDIVFGEHSISMIDAAFKNIVFSSCNVTGHRNFFEDITKLGFPHCKSLEDICNLLRNATSAQFRQNYSVAIDNYNKMTDIE